MKNVLVIDVQRQPIEVIADVDKCEYILSSSLHGVIAADSLGIPNAWILLSDKVLGSGFKFYDYASAFGMKYEPECLSGSESLSELINMTHRVSNRIQEIKNSLDSVFKHFSHQIVEHNRNNQVNP